MDDSSAAIPEVQSAAGVSAFGDLNNDGWQDVVMTSLGSHLKVFINVAANCTGS